MIRSHLIPPHGREADSAEWAARRAERAVVIPRERRVTQQGDRRVASRMGFGAQARNTSLRALQMTNGIQRGSRLVSEPVRQKRGS
jgi:hypothetical protein